VPVITEVSAAQFAPGGVLTIRFTLNNVGQTSALISDTGIFLSPDANITLSDTLIGTVLPGTIPAGGSANGHVDYIIADAFVGTFQIGVWADYTQRWTENVESNNIATQTVTIGAVPSSLADLQFDNVALPKSRVIYGEQFEIEYDIRNVGAANSARSDVSFYLSTNRTFDPDDDRFLTNNFYGRLSNGVQIGLAPGARDGEAATLAITASDVQAVSGNAAPQNLYIIMVIDEDRRGLESDRTDNVISRRVTIADAPQNWIGYTDHIAYDLILSDISYTLGDSLQFTVKLKNQGTIDAEGPVGFGQYADLIWRNVSSGAEAVLGISSVPDGYVRSQEFLTSGQLTLREGDLVPGYYDVFARVRTDTAEPLDRQSNNDSNAVRVFFGSDAQRRLLEMPDLSIEALTITRGATGALSATATIANKGGLAVSAGTTAAFYVERTDGTGFQIVKSVALGALDAAFDALPVTMSLAFTDVQLPYLAPGEYRAGVLLDIFDILDEAEAGNNLREGLVFQSNGTVYRTGTAAAELFDGGPGADTIDGFGGNDTLNGGGGADLMRGGLGGDRYSVDSLQDSVVELPNQGTDTVLTSLPTFVLGPNIENITATTSIAHRFTGNALANVMTGNAGADTLIGGTGNDSYVVDNAGDRVIERLSQGIDTVRTAAPAYTLPSNVENLVGTFAGGQSLTGNTLANAIKGFTGTDTLTGGPGDDTLDGGAGADTMQGGNGNDIYVVGSLGDRVIEASGGIDLVRSSVSFNLSGQFIENLTLTGAAAINGTGNSLSNGVTGNGAANHLQGFGGHDTLDGGAGADTMDGGNGNDVYVVDSVGDRVMEASGGGSDMLVASLSATLAVTIENLTLAGSSGYRGTGHAGANAIEGNRGANLLSGLGGADTLGGGEGNDTLLGGTGADLLRGDAGADLFRFDRTADSPGSGPDRILDFAQGLDRIGFEADANRPFAGPARTGVAFSDLHALAAADSAAEVLAALLLVAASGATLQLRQAEVAAGAAAGTWLYVNDGVAGISAADLLIRLDLAPGTVLTAADIVLV
jgi:Ca2+-binding RTX toxin-like protein